MKFFAPLIIIIVSIGMYFFYITPKAAEVKALYQQKVRYSNVLDKVRQLTSLRDQVLQEYNSVSETDIEHLNKIIPNKFDSILFANDMSALAIKNKLTFENYRANASGGDRGSVLSQSSSSHKTVQVSFKMVGQYSDFLAFLTSLESSLQLSDLTSLTINPTSVSKTGVQQMEFLLEINVYSLQ